MTNGAVIFAQNSANLDYVKMAVFSAKKLKDHLDIPVSLITDSAGWLEQGYPDHVFDKVITLEHSTNNQYKKINDGTLASKKIEWKNVTRDRIYQLTPYDKTLVIDSDYIINSSVLKSAFDNDHDFQIYKRSMDLAMWRPTDEFNRISQWSVPFYWATTFIFTKNNIMESFFDLVAYIKSNWTYFRTLYCITSGTYRNDYAFSIAIHIMNGKTNGEFATELPGTMTYCTDKDLLISMENNTLKFLIEKQNYIGEYTLAKTQGIDVHVMNKLSLCRCIDGGIGV
jgi:hypothetical protein